MKKYLFLLLLAFCLLLFANHARALTNEEILERISNLEKEVASLRVLLILPEKATQEQTTLEEEKINPPLLPVNNSCHLNVNGSWDYCSKECPCANGEGDCDNHLECQSGYCAYDTGALYGLSKTIDVCQEKPFAPPSALVPAQTFAPPSSIVNLSGFQEADYLMIKGRVLDRVNNQPIEGAQVYFGFKTNKKGIFEIKLNQTLFQQKEIEIKAPGYFLNKFSFCQNCWGYQTVLALDDPTKEGLKIVYPVFSNSIEIGDVFLERANDLKVISDRFVQVKVELRTAKGDFVLAGLENNFSQTNELLDVLKENNFSRIILIDKQGQEYVSPPYFQQADSSLPAVLSFVSGKFLWGVCGNGICEREDLTCPSDCTNACLEGEEQAPNKCIFGCEENTCKRDIFLSFPQTTQTFKTGDKIEIEWLQVGLGNQTLDFEVLAFNQENNLVQGFQYLIATSVNPALGGLSFQLPNDLKSENKYKIVVYNKMCSESGETLVSCLKERYSSKSENFFILTEPPKGKAPSFAQSQLANIAQAASLLLEKIQQLLK
ncbi:carboxypeptidase-like regulatory domain-containing protein [Candidatus Parcubacteria bacterium]|nr:carboxypeptidase-like regulatory domain-containing protein [Candidatus Parcubacteria bacterium]